MHSLKQHLIRNDFLTFFGPDRRSLHKVRQDQGSIFDYVGKALKLRLANSIWQHKVWPNDSLGDEILKDPTARHKAYHTWEISESALKQLRWHELPNNCHGALSLPRTSNMLPWVKVHKRHAPDTKDFFFMRETLLFDYNVVVSLNQDLVWLACFLNWEIERANTNTSVTFWSCKITTKSNRKSTASQRMLCFTVQSMIIRHFL